MKFSIATLFLIVSEATAGRQLLEDDCTLYAIADARLPSRRLGQTYSAGDLDFVCEPNDNGGTYRLNLTKGQQKFFEEGMDNGSVVSGATTIKSAYYEGDQIILSENTTYGRKEQPIKPEQMEKKSILVVRVTDKDGKVISDSAAQVGDNIFGTLNDPVNLKSQMFDCSYGAVDITNEYSSPNIDDKLSAPGVLDVTIPIAIDGSDGDRYAIHNAVTAAANAKLGYNLPGQHEQVMYVLEKCYTNCGWAAYAYINSWMSVYQSTYYLMTGVQMHEIGHNLGMAHSGGLDGATYTDHTCLMGNPLYSDDIGKMCFNPAKNWYVNWYDDYKTTVDITVPNISEQITMVGIAEITANNPDKMPAVLKLETGTSDDYFIGFNRAIGINSQNDEADDEVTIIQTGNNGMSYSQSYLKAHLLQGEFYNIGDLKITATSIDISKVPGTAIITLEKGTVTVPPTKTPTTSTTKTPTLSPTKSPTTTPPTKTPTTTPPTKIPTTSPPTTTPPTRTPTTSLPTRTPTTVAPTAGQQCGGLSRRECKKNPKCFYGRKGPCQDIEALICEDLNRRDCRKVDKCELQGRRRCTKK